MHLELRVVHTVDPELLAVFHAIHTELADMNTHHLTASVAALVAGIAASDAKLDTLAAGIPDLIKAAVTEALAAADVDAETAAGLIDQALADSNSHVEALLAAATPAAPAPPPPAPEPSAGDVVATGDAHAAPSGEDTTSGADTAAAADVTQVQGDAGTDPATI